ncbi:MAG: carboxymuconolactone decarboxylase family protein [Clostridia bacterium]|nr:carboxymuconolactone decarboxylase family protein [Clostridia bacterium]
MDKVTNGFRMFLEQTEGVGPAFMQAVQKQAEVSALDEKTRELAYIAVLVTARMHGGLPFHVDRARQLGATEGEIRGAMLVPLPVIGIQAAEALPYIGG